MRGHAGTVDLQFANCVTFVFSLFFLFFSCSSSSDMDPLSPLDYNHSPPGWTPPVIGSNLTPPLTNQTALCVFFFFILCVCFYFSLPSSTPLLYLFFGVCGKQMKNLGQKAVSVCSLKRTICARGKSCSNCAAERARKRADGTSWMGVKGTAGGFVDAQGTPRLLHTRLPAHSLTVT